MMMISQYFDRNEFACGCGCGFNTVDTELLRTLERTRATFSRPMIITSGCRCEAHNEAQGGSPKSQHLLGRAADFVIPGVDPAIIQKYLCETHPGRFGIGCYADFTHFDTRDTEARW